MQFQNYLCKKTESSYPHLSWAHNWCLRASTMKSGLCNEEFINAGLDCAFVATDFAFSLQELSRNRVGKWASPSIPAPSLSPSRPSIKFFVFSLFWVAGVFSFFFSFVSQWYICIISFFTFFFTFRWFCCSSSSSHHIHCQTRSLLAAMWRHWSQWTDVVLYSSNSKCKEKKNELQARAPSTASNAFKSRTPWVRLPLTNQKLTVF